MQLRLYKDERGIPRAEAPPPQEALGWWLNQDIQRDLGACDEVLSVIQDIRAGRLANWEGTGNVHTITITREGARIETEFAVPPRTAEVSLDELQEAISRWKELITQDPRS